MTPSKLQRENARLRRLVAALKASHRELQAVITTLAAARVVWPVDDAAEQRILALTTQVRQTTH